MAIFGCSVLDISAGVNKFLFPEKVLRSQQSSWVEGTNKNKCGIPSKHPSAHET
jgi:hypothetical protein